MIRYLRILSSLWLGACAGLSDSDMSLRDSLEDVGLRLQRANNEICILTDPVLYQAVCNYPVIIYEAAEINAYMTTQAVFISQPLLQRIRKPSVLGFIIAHEAAHAFMGHIDQRPQREFELEADRIALIMIARAGYNIDKVIKEMHKLVYHYKSVQGDIHPDPADRLTNLHCMRDWIRQRWVEDLPLVFGREICKEF